MTNLFEKTLKKQQKRFFRSEFLAIFISLVLKILSFVLPKIRRPARAWPDQRASRGGTEKVRPKRAARRRGKIPMGSHRSVFYFAANKVKLNSECRKLNQSLNQ